MLLNIQQCTEQSHTNRRTIPAPNMSIVPGLRNHTLGHFLTVKVAPSCDYHTSTPPPVKMASLLPPMDSGWPLPKISSILAGFWVKAEFVLFSRVVLLLLPLFIAV